jgi:hypothetical protein
MPSICFPCTYLSRAELQVLERWLHRPVLYRPSALELPDRLEQWHREGRIELRIPITGDEQLLASVLKDYRRWAELHADKHGIDRGHPRGASGALPFFDDTFTAQIRAEIRKRAAPRGIPKPQPGAADEKRFLARVFLSIAQELDFQLDRLGDDLRRLEEKERVLFREMQGGEGRTHLGAAAAGPGMTIKESGDHWTVQRLEAWTLLMAADMRQMGGAASGVFVTTSLAALEEVLDHHPEAWLLPKLPSAAMDKSAGEVENGRFDLMAWLQRQALGSPPPGTGEIRFSALTAAEMGPAGYLIPGRSPVETFRRCLPRGDLVPEPNGSSEGPKFTILVYLPE